MPFSEIKASTSSAFVLMATREIAMINFCFCGSYTVQCTVAASTGQGVLGGRRGLVVAGRPG